MNASLDTLLLADGTEFKPATVDYVEYEHEGKISRNHRYSEVENECKVSYRRETNDEPDLTVEGIVQKSQLDELKDLKTATELKVVTDIETSIVGVERLRLEQISDLVSVTINGRTESAFLFKLDLKATGQ